MVATRDTYNAIAKFYMELGYADKKSGKEQRTKDWPRWYGFGMVFPRMER